MLKIYKQIEKTIGEIMEDQITVYSAQASFYLIISTFPFIMLLISLAGYFIPIPKQTIIASIQSFLPEAVKSTVEVLADELFDKSIQVISLTAITTLWSASRGIAAVERGIRKVYKTPERIIFIADYAASIVYTILFIAIILLTLLLQVFGNVIISFAERYIIFNSTEIILIKGVLFFILMCVSFQLMYYIFSRRKIKLKHHLPGAAFSAIGWMIFSNLFSVYIDNFANYSYIYGSLTAVVLMMLWLYFCVMILLLGAELNSRILKKGDSSK